MKSLQIVGRLGRDGECKRTNSGEAVLNLSVAVDDRKKVNGTWMSETLWVTVTLFGKRAEGLAQHCAKGVRIAAQGDLNVRTYQKRDGGEGTSIELFARDVEVLFDRREGSAQSSDQRAAAQQPRQGGAGYDAGPSGGAADFDDIPFGPVDTRGEV
jgi:single-strand DNA-binding protein